MYFYIFLCIFMFNSFWHSKNINQIYIVIIYYTRLNNYFEIVL